MDGLHELAVCDSKANDLFKYSHIARVAFRRFDKEVALLVRPSLQHPVIVCDGRNALSFGKGQVVCRVVGVDLVAQYGGADSYARSQAFRSTRVIVNRGVRCIDCVHNGVS